MLGKLRRLRRSLLGLLALLMVLTAVQVGPLALPAFAPDLGCTPHWGLRTISTPIGPMVERCEPVEQFSDLGRVYTIWDWVPYDGQGEEQRTLWAGGATSPPYRMVLADLLARGQGGGASMAKVILYNRDGSHLSRTIAARSLIQYEPTGSSGWYTCTDSGWKQASTSTYAMRAYVQQYKEPNCGPAYYRALAAGRFWSISLNKWITRGWISSPSMWITLPVGTTPTEPVSQPTTLTPDTPD